MHEQIKVSCFTRKVEMFYFIFYQFQYFKTSVKYWNTIILLEDLSTPCLALITTKKKSGVHEQRHTCLALITGTLLKGKKIQKQT